MTRSWVGKTQSSCHHHPVSQSRVGQTQRHAIIIPCLKVELDRHSVMPSSSCDSKLSWTDKSSCYYHLASWTDTPLWRQHLTTGTRPGTYAPLTTLSLPNEDFGRMNKRWNPDFEWSTFQGREYSIWATNRWKVLRKSGFHLLFILPKSSFGEHKLNNKSRT